MSELQSPLQRFGLRYNPFPPATTGVALIDDIALPPTWESELRQRLSRLDDSAGEKALAIVGAYGSGKTFILHWIAQEVLPPQRLQPYVFDNPGVAFYDLANRLMREVGRYELSKAIWEMLYKPLPQLQSQLTMVPHQFPDWLSTLRDKDSRNVAIHNLSNAIREWQFTTDEEIANKFARVVVETREKPYYEYRDFVPRTSNSVVAEREEAGYFSTLIRLLLKILEVRGIAFLIDEFEDVALSRRLNRRQTSEYMATLRRLLDTAREENFLLILSMTPEGLDQTSSLDPSLMERFAETYTIPALSDTDAYDVIKRRLDGASEEKAVGLHPFSDDVLSSVKLTTRSSPRRLVKVFWRALALAADRQQNPPIEAELVRLADEELYPGEMS